MDGVSRKLEIRAMVRVRVILPSPFTRAFDIIRHSDTHWFVNQSYFRIFSNID